MPSRQVPVGRFTLADVDAARQRADVVVHAVVGDLQIMAPGVYEDAAAALRAVSNGQPVNARRIALEVAWIRLIGIPDPPLAKQSRAGEK